MQSVIYISDFVQKTIQSLEKQVAPVCITFGSRETVAASATTTFAPQVLPGDMNAKLGHMNSRPYITLNGMHPKHSQL